MRIREIAVDADERIVDRFRGGFVNRFGRQTCGICALFVRHLQAESGFVGVRKLALIFSDLVDGPPDKFAELRCYWPFAFADYQPATDAKKREMIATSLRDALMWCADHVGWEHAKVEAAWEQVVRDRLLFQGFSPTTWRSSNRKLRARIWYSIDLEQLTLDAVLVPSRGMKEVARKRIAVVPPYTGCLRSYVNKVAWTSETTLTITSESFPPKQWTVDFADELAQC